jgi:ribosomal protein L40E
VKICSKCSAKNDLDASFCEECGHKLEEHVKKNVPEMRKEKHQKKVPPPKTKLEEKKETPLKEEKSRVLFAVGKKHVTLGSVFVLAIILMILLLPAKTVSYTKNVPYEVQEVVYDTTKEPITKTEVLYDKFVTIPKYERSIGIYNFYLDKGTETKISLISSDEGDVFDYILAKNDVCYIRGEEADAKKATIKHSGVLSKENVFFEQVTLEDGVPFSSQYCLFIFRDKQKTETEIRVRITESWADGYKEVPNSNSETRTVTKNKEERKYKRVNWLFEFKVPW